MRKENDLRQTSPYEEMVETLPKNWSIKRLKFVCEINPTKADLRNASSDMAVTFLPMEKIGEDGSLDLSEERPLTEVFQGYTYMADYDVILAKITPCFENGKAALCRNLRNGVAFGTTELHVLRTHGGFHPQFIFYILRSYLFRKMGTTEMYGVAGQQRVPESFVRDFRAGFPSYHQQAAIAAFLDHKTAQIDALIAEKRRLIDLLQEKRNALIIHAVTKGLDPDARMKDSGVEWIGEVPEGWEVQAVWTLFNLGRGRVISHEDIHENPGPYPVYSSQTENDGILGHIDTYDFSGKHLTWTTDGAKAGTVFYRIGKFNCTNVCGTLEPLRDDLDLRFMRHALNIATSWFVRHDINPKLMNNVMSKIRVQVPSTSEQREIAEFLEVKSKHISDLITEVKEAVGSLIEYRTALISAAVTGKIDVREALPVETDS